MVRNKKPEEKSKLEKHCLNRCGFNPHHFFVRKEKEMSMTDEILRSLVNVNKDNTPEEKVNDEDIFELADIFKDDKEKDMDMRIFDILEPFMDELASGKISPDDIKVKIDIKHNGSRYTQKYIGANRQLFKRGE